MFQNVVIFFFILSCICNCLYYLWVSFLFMFPPVIHSKEKSYSDNIDIYFFLVIPCLDEEKVIASTITNLLSLNMPNTTVIAINDDSCDNTLEILKSIKNEHLLIINREEPNARQGKGEALNDAYRHIKYLVSYNNEEAFNSDFDVNRAIKDIVTIANERGIDHSNVVIGILDADTFIKKSLLERVAVIMNDNPKAGMVQTRVRIGTSTRNYFLPLMQDIEFFSCINQMQNVREYMGTVGAAGNGQFNRLSAMEQLGDHPWSKCLLEDFDFSLRLLLKGWRTRLLQDETTYQQGVINYRKFVKQRTRWVQGSIQCLHYLGEIKKSKCLSFIGKAELLCFMLLPWITIVSTATMVFSWFLILYFYWMKTSYLYTMLSPYTANQLLALLITILVLVYLPGIVISLFYRHDSKESLFNCLLSGLFIPIYNMLQIPAVLIAVFRQAFGSTGWVKTDRV